MRKEGKSFQAEQQQMQKSGAQHESTEEKSWQGEDKKDEVGPDPERPFAQCESWLVLNIPSYATVPAS